MILLDEAKDVTERGISMEEIRTASAEMALRRMMYTAVKEGASDIHIEPGKEIIRIRFRKDGRLMTRFQTPIAMAQGLAVRAKVLGRMNVGESRIPQDGSYTEDIDGLSYDFRISILPSMYGETIVIRMLPRRVDFIENNDLGMLSSQKELFQKALQRKQGMILTTGPTGSGKTSTLYAALKLLNQEEVSIISIEDPVEYRIPGITQIQVNETAGMTFAEGLRSLVRQDPDIVMIGEIRDRETAEIAIHAALTGHLVLSTLHTNGAASAPLRLMDMGIPPYLLSASLSLIMAQRLVRRLCVPCKKEIELTEACCKENGIPLSYAGKRACAAVGCESCQQQGYEGRIGVFEMIPIGKGEREIIHHDFSVDRLREHMKKQGYLTMGETALVMMEQGILSPHEAGQMVQEEE